ncbi:MAG TPA: DUF1549 domain-containing protein [Gemmataceae bacterium]|jgi:hypothetical protein|nr:DUF1549 domain-containing protein [Gemmataceae bacterium]
MLGYPALRCALFLLVCSVALVAGRNAQAQPQSKTGAAAKDHDDKKVEGTHLTGEDAEKVRLINEHLSTKWKENKINPSYKATDYEFIRRASLDIIGRVAKPQEIEKFLKDPEHSRRFLLIERLLKSDEYPKNQANLWTVWLMTRAGANETGGSIYHEQMHKWLEDQFKKEGLSFKEMVRELLTASGKTNENGAVNYILSHLGEPVPKDKQQGEDGEGKFTMVPVTSRTTKLFLGVQIQCTQCHKHPFNEEWNQAHFWGINAFFRQVDRKGAPIANREVVLELVDNPSLDPSGAVYYEERNGRLQQAKAVFLDGTHLDAASSNRRIELARFVTSSKLFPKAYVNRMWAHFFGRGFTNPVDDFGSQNEPSHPELLEELASAFDSYGTDPRRLIRWICNSDAYGLTSVSNKSNEKTDAEPFFSRMLLKAMTPEQLFESLIVSTQAEMFESRENRQKLRREWMRNLTTNFGDDEGNEVTFNGTVVQALMLMNGNDINSAVASKTKGTVPWAIIYKKTPKGIMDHLYLAALNRPPSGRESGRVLEILRKAPSKANDSLSLWQDLFWALLNSNEFILNH